MEQILEEELGALSACYMERTTKDVLPSRIIVVGASKLDIKMERPMGDQEVNAAYWYHSQWRDIRLRVESYKK
jgi:hypothetical protein